VVADGSACAEVVEPESEARIVSITLQHVHAEERDVELPSPCGETLGIRLVGERPDVIPICERGRRWIEAEAVTVARDCSGDRGDLLLDAATTCPRADVRIRENPPRRSLQRALAG